MISPGNQCTISKTQKWAAPLHFSSSAINKISLVINIKMNTNTEIT